MRQYQGLNGFLLRTESEHDCYGAGHAGTALSRRPGHGGRPRSVAAGTRTSSSWPGDAAFTCGISYEALNNVEVADASASSSCLNDNEWSIAKNVGAIASYLNNIVDESDLRAACTTKRGRFIEAIAGQARVAPRAQSRGGREEPAPAERDLRGTRLALLRPDRRPRHSAAHQDLRVPEDAGRAGAPAHPDQEGQRL